jgi:hypothetical protein
MYSIYVRAKTKYSNWTIMNIMSHVILYITFAKQNFKLQMEVDAVSSGSEAGTPTPGGVSPVPSGTPNNKPASQTTKIPTPTAVAAK